MSIDWRVKHGADHMRGYITDEPKHPDEDTKFILFFGGLRGTPRINIITSEANYRKAYETQAYCGEHGSSNDMTIPLCDDWWCNRPVAHDALPREEWEAIWAGARRAPYIYFGGTIEW